MNILAIKPFYIFSGSLILLCILYIVFVVVIYPSIRKNKVMTQLVKSANLNNKKITIVTTKLHDATFQIKIEDKCYLAKVVMVSKNCDLQINNIDTFVVYKKSSADTYKSKCISNMTQFMKAKEENKIILLSNKAKTIKKVINECEMIMVNPKVDVHGVHIYNFNDYNDLFN